MHRDLKKERKITITLLIMITILLGTMAFLVIAFYQSTRPVRLAESEAIKIAKTHGSLKKVEAFYQYNRKEASYTVAGENKDNQKLFVLIPQSGKGIQTVKQDQGVTEKQAISVVKNEHSGEDYIETNLGLEGLDPTWEVVTKSDSGKYNYYLVDFKEGKIVKSIKNV